MTSRFDVYVVPRSSVAGPSGRHGGIPRLRVKSPPAGGRANQEAERTLTVLLGDRVRLTGGARSRRKVFDIELDQTELDARLRRVFGE